MAYGFDIKYFNSFWLKKAIKNYTSANTQSSTWPGLPWNPLNYPTFPYDGGAFYTTGTVYNWYVEESRIRGGYNNVSVDLGVRAHIVNEENKQLHRTNALIYSGIFNSRTGINETNQFSVGQDITRALDPAHGSIQKLFAEDTNLIIFQENKVSRALIDKDTIYTTEGGTSTQVMGKVIGQIVPYLGQYGISDNPESFASFGFRKYFCDRYRGLVLRLSRDGITEISSYGMRDYFRDYLTALPNDFTLRTVPYVTNDVASSTSVDVISSTCPDIDIGASIYVISGGVLIPLQQFSTSNPPSPLFIEKVEEASSGIWKITFTGEYTIADGSTIAAGQTIYIGRFTKSHIPGGWDNHSYNYTLSMQASPPYISTESANYATLSFDESVSGWTSFYSYKPMFLDSLKSNFYSFVDSNVYQHYDEITDNSRGNFYGVQNDSTVTFVFNPNVSVVKNFQTIGYEGSNGWEVDEFKSGEEGVDLVGVAYNLYQDQTATVKSYSEGLYTENGIPLRAGFDRKENKYVANLINNSNARPGEVVFGESSSGVKGYFATVKLSTDATTEVGGMKELFAVSSKFVTSSY